MNTKTILLTMAVSGLLTAFSVSAGTRNTKVIIKDDIDYTTVNVVVKAIADQVLAGETQVDWVNPKFDVTRSSLEDEKIYYSAEGAMKSVPWSSTDKPTAQAMTSYEADRISPMPGIAVKVSATVKLDFLPFARYAAAVALKNIRFYDEEYKVRLLSILNRATQVKSIAEIYTLIQESQAMAIESIQSKIKKQYDELQCITNMTCGSPTVDQWGNRNIDYAAAQSTSNQIQILKRNLVSVEANRFSLVGDTLALSNASPQGYGADDNWNSDWIEAKIGTITLTPTSVSTAGRIFAYLKIKNLDKLKAQLHKEGKLIPQRDAAHEADIQRSFRNGLALFKDAINGVIKY